MRLAVMLAMAVAIIHGVQQFEQASDSHARMLAGLTLLIWLVGAGLIVAGRLRGVVAKPAVLAANSDRKGWEPFYTSPPHRVRAVFSLIFGLGIACLSMIPFEQPMDWRLLSIPIGVTAAFVYAIGSWGTWFRLSSEGIEYHNGFTEERSVIAWRSVTAVHAGGTLCAMIVTEHRKISIQPSADADTRVLIRALREVLTDFVLPGYLEEIDRGGKVDMGTITVSLKGIAYDLSATDRRFKKFMQGISFDELSEMEIDEKASIKLRGQANRRVVDATLPFFSIRNGLLLAPLLEHAISAQVYARKIVHIPI